MTEIAKAPQIAGVGIATNGTNGTTDSIIAIDTTILVDSTSPPRFTNRFVAATVIADSKHKAIGNRLELIQPPRASAARKSSSAIDLKGGFDGGHFWNIGFEHVLDTLLQRHR